LPMAELDNPAWWALAGYQRALGRATPLAARFDPDVSPFGAFEGAPAAAHWEAMAVLCDPCSTVAIITVDEDLVVPPMGWTKSWEGAGVQMVAVAGLEPHGPDPGDVPNVPVVALGADDVPDMLDLVAEARPGPFSTRTVEFGGYVGIRRDTRLVAMAGERLRPPGFAEISAVATAPGHRRQGLAELLIRTVASSVTARGEIPFLHAAASNKDAIRLYESLGFTVRRKVRFSVVAVPERP
jgi:ribosomal protein S18 acetylase RimI-like enzyme